MDPDEDDTTTGGADRANPPASPPCEIDEVDPALAGLDMTLHPPVDLQAWRRLERDRLIGARMALSQNERADFTAHIIRRLSAVLAGQAGGRISFYWPFRGEPDLRPLMARLTAEGRTCLLPIVVAKAAPLIFRAWREGEPLERGVWNIPVPAGGPELAPDIVIAPLVGFDRALFRLGYGGGFFDRTLAGLSPRPLAIGVGYDLQAIPQIFPHRHDIPMDIVITESRTLRRIE